MAIDYKIGDKLYLPVTVINGASQLYPIKVEFFCDIDTVNNVAIANKPGLLLTAEEVAEKELGEPGKDYILVGNHNFMTFPSKTLVVSEEETRIKALTDKIATLTDERDGARKQADIFQEEIKKLTADRDKFAKTAKDKADLANKACDERYDARVDLVTARATINHLQEENRDLKRKLEVVEAARDGAIDESFKRKNRVTTMEEVIVALVEKIRGLEGGET